MNLVFYSGGDIEDNEELDLEVLRLIDKSSPSMTYIPSCFEDAHFQFEEFVESFSYYGVRDFMMFPVDIPFSKSQLNKALNRDFVFLSGGNTYYFLKYLRANGVLKELKKFVNRGGVLGGLSAGAIMMTPTIDTAGFPDFDRDENEVGIKNLNALNLMPFEFFPHYLNSRKYIEELNHHSVLSSIPLYACPDGSGIIVENHQLRFIGRTWCFHNGQRFKLI